MNARLERLQKALCRDGVDAALYATSGNMQYFLDDTSYAWQRTPYTGFPFDSPNGHQLNVPDCVLYVPASGEATVFASYARARDMGQLKIKVTADYFCRLTDVMAELVRGEKFALGESCNVFLRQMVQDFLPGAQFVDGEHYGTEMRALKDEREIAALRSLARFTDEAMGKIVELLRPGISNTQVEKEIGRLGYDYGCRELPFAPTVRFCKTGGGREFQVDGFRTDAVLEEGCSISFDFGFTKDGYCTDFGRSFYCGRAPQEIADSYRALQEAQLELISRIKPGDPMCDGYEFIERHMARYGFAQYLHKYPLDLLGHQLGIEVHEGPWLHNKQSEVFRPGMVFTIEPKFWWPDRCFTRVEDMILITDTGAECLTNFDRELFSRPTD